MNPDSPWPWNETQDMSVALMGPGKATPIHVIPVLGPPGDVRAPVKLDAIVLSPDMARG